MASEDEDIEPSEFDKLILDEVKIEKFSEADKVYLEEFENVKTFGLNGTKLNSLANFPKMVAVTRLEMSENYITGADLKNIRSLTGLLTLKVANN